MFNFVKKSFSLIGIVIFGLILMFNLFAINSTWAEEKKLLKPSQSQPTTDKSKYDTKPFNIMIEKLPPNYKGHDIEKLYNDLKRKFPKKGEFETRDNYIKRIQLFISNTLVDTDLFAFAIENRIDIPVVDVSGSHLAYSQNLDSAYNAEGQTFEVKLESSSVINLSYDRYDEQSFDDVLNLIEKLAEAKVKAERDENSEDYKRVVESEAETVVMTKSIQEKIETYVGSNVFGTNIKIYKDKQRQYGLSLLNKEKFGEGIVKEHLIKIDISPEEAKSFKKNHGVLLICRLKASANPISYVVFESYLHTEPTFDNPFELAYSQNFIFVDLLEIWVYHKKTGQIFTKVKIDDAKENATGK